MDDPYESLEATVELILQLADLISTRERSLLPSDLQIINSIVDKIMDVLEDSVDYLMEVDERLDEVKIKLHKDTFFFTIVIKNFFLLRLPCQ